MTPSASAVTSGVTYGLPSRSPPIQDPKVSSAGTGTSSPGNASPTATSMSR